MGAADDDKQNVPPYEGRQKSADVDETGSRKEGARVGGATGPVEDDEQKAPDSESTPRGSVASPADEQPAKDAPEDEGSAEGTGPGHEPGTPRGEDRGA